MKPILKTKEFSLSYWLNAILLVFVAGINLKPAFSSIPQAARLEKWSFNSQKQQLEINLSPGKTPECFYLPQPPRLVIDLPETQLGQVLKKKSYQGIVQQVRLAQLNPSVTRIVLDLIPGTFFSPEQIKIQSLSPKKLNHWLIQLATQPNNVILPSNQAIAPSLNSPASKLFPIPGATLPSSLNLNNNPEKPFIIVPPLDAENSNLTNQREDSAHPSENPQSVIKPKSSDTSVIEFGQPIPR